MCMQHDDLNAPAYRHRLQISPIAGFLNIPPVTTLTDPAGTRPPKA